MSYIVELLPIIVWILTVVSWWVIFGKANEAGWKALIPFYSDYIRYKIAGKRNMYWLYLAAVIGRTVTSTVSIFVLIGNIWNYISTGIFDSTGIEIRLVSWGLAFVCLAFDIYLTTFIAKRFGKSEGFGIGLGLLPIVFVPILAFGKAEYEQKEWI